MSFICDPCLNEKYLNEPEEISQHRTIGVCDDCGFRRDCSDIPSGELIRRPEGEEAVRLKPPYYRLQSTAALPKESGDYEAKTVNVRVDKDGILLTIGPLTKGFRPRAKHRPEAPTAEATPTGPQKKSTPDIDGWWIGKLHNQAELIYVRASDKYAIRYDGSSIKIPGNPERVWWGPITLPKGWGP